MDRNTIIGFGLLAVLFFGYFYYTQQGQSAVVNQKKHIEDSLKKLQPKIDTVQIQAKQADSLAIISASTGQINIDSTVSKTSITLENNLAKYTFSNKGAQPELVELKNFKTAFGEPLILNDGKFNNISYELRVGNKSVQSSDILFTQEPVQTGADSSQTLRFILKTHTGEIVEHTYILRPDNYMVDFTIRINGANNLLSQNALNILWEAKAIQMEKEIEWETQQSHVSFFENGDYDFERFVKGKSDEKLFTKPINWVSVNQQFFVNSLIAKNKFNSGNIKWESPKDTALHIIGKATAHLKLDVAGNDVLIPLQLYYGPNDYKILKSYDNGMQNIVPLGSGIFAFIKYVNRGFIIPVFNFLSNHMVSYGLMIALLTIIIRLLISPLTYQSYLSGAKMKLLKPEIEALKAKHGDDKQAFGMEQMKLFKSAGVNPLGGCIPAVLQIPIFFALYNFFNSNIALRGESFWWANDLSSYDSIYTMPFSIPFYGDHVSLFTILAVVTSLLISLYGMANMQDTGNPMMKYLPFIFPVVLLGVFNRMPAALTWYYTVSNVITLLIQFVIQNYIIDHEKILAKLQENKKRPVSKSKWQDKIDAMQQSNDKLKQLKAKNDARKK